MCLPPHVLYCIDGEFEKILTKLRLRIKDNNNHLYRVSFVDFYFAFPTNFRVVFLPHTNTVILLEKYYCGTWLSSFYIKSFNIIIVPGWPNNNNMEIKIRKSLEIATKFVTKSLCTFFCASKSLKTSQLINKIKA